MKGEVKHAVYQGRSEVSCLSRVLFVKGAVCEGKVKGAVCKGRSGEHCFNQGEVRDAGCEGRSEERYF